jgi:hypothetical protein
MMKFQLMLQVIFHRLYYHPDPDFPMKQGF